jgi:hypothetical protein
METMNRQVILFSVVHAPVLSYRVGLQFLRMKRSAKKARARFYKELLSSGIPPRQAKDLADRYVSVVSIRSLIQTMRSASTSSLL